MRSELQYKGNAWCSVKRGLFYFILFLFLVVDAPKGGTHLINYLQPDELVVRWSTVELIRYRAELGGIRDPSQSQSKHTKKKRGQRPEKEKKRDRTY